MLEILVIFLAIVAVALGVIVRNLFRQLNQIRLGFESRLRAIEGLEVPFRHKLAEAGPAPLKRGLTLGIHLDARFWSETLQLTVAELDEIKTSIRLHDVLTKEGGTKDFDSWFYGDILVHIQEWRGGYTHVKVEHPFIPSERPKSIDLYDGRRRKRLWQFDLPLRKDGFLSGGTLWLDWDGAHLRLYATGARFGWASLTDTDPAPGNVFLSVPVGEGPQSEAYYRLSYSADLHPPMWNRRYQHLDLQKGLAWSLAVDDCDLLAGSEGSARTSRDLLFAEWHTRFAWNEEGRDWLKRFAKIYEDREARESAKLAERSAAGDESWECRCGALIDRTEFREACPHCGQRFA
jgi:hypothetical protein